MKTDLLDLIIPDWPAPAWVKAVTTTRCHGFSEPPFASLNLSPYVGDKPGNVAKNQQRLKNALGIVQLPIWLRQVHGTRAISADSPAIDIVADAIYSHQSQKICAVQTADCLPILACSCTHHCIAAIHAGWKGLAAGIIENSINALSCPTNTLLVWLGPAIGPQVFVVGEEVLQAFVEKDSQANQAFQYLGNKRWLADLYQLAKQRLNTLGIHSIYGSNYCTYTNKELFFSFRRDKITGRMASLIWLDSDGFK
jgi:polyphenol oxidase